MRSRVRVRELLAHKRVVGAVPGLRECEQRHEALAAHLLRTSARADGDPFVGEHRDRDAPAVVDVADERVDREPYVVEEHLVEVRVPVDLAQRERGDAREPHVDDEHADAPVLGHLGVRRATSRP